MRTHVIYTYNERDIMKKGRTLEANSITKLIDTSVSYADFLFSKSSVSSTTRYYIYMPYSKQIIFHSHTVNVHGHHHHCHFTLNGSPATLRKACNHFEFLGINKR